MEAYALQDVTNARELVGLAHRSEEPVVVFDGIEECMVVMRPAVFERILFDSDLLNWASRETLHI